MTVRSFSFQVSEVESARATLGTAAMKCGAMTETLKEAGSPRSRKAKYKQKEEELKTAPSTEKLLPLQTLDGG